MDVLNQAALMRAFELAKSSYRPKEILDLEAEIGAEIRVLEVRESAGQPIRREDVSKVVRMKLRRDQLYADWVGGRLE